MKNKFLTLFTFLFIFMAVLSNAKAAQNVYFDTSGKAFYYGTDGKPYFYPENIPYNQLGLVYFDVNGKAYYYGTDGKPYFYPDTFPAHKTKAKNTENNSENKALKEETIEKVSDIIAGSTQNESETKVETEKEDTTQETDKEPKQSWYDKTMKKYHSYMEDLESKNKDCEQAVNKAHENRLKLKDDILIFDNIDVVDSDKRIVTFKNKNRVIDILEDGLVISQDKCFMNKKVVKSLQKSSMLSNNSLPLSAQLALGTMSATGTLIDEMCEEKEDEYIFITTSDMGHANNENMHKQKYIYERDDAYSYNDTHIRAYKETTHEVSDITYNKFLNNKDLKCCSNGKKVTVCNYDIF